MTAKFRICCKQTITVSQRNTALFLLLLQHIKDPFPVIVPKRGCTSKMRSDHAGLFKILFSGLKLCDLTACASWCVSCRKWTETALFITNSLWTLSVSTVINNKNNKSFGTVSKILPSFLKSHFGFWRETNYYCKGKVTFLQFQSGSV